MMRRFFLTLLLGLCTAATPLAANEVAVAPLLDASHLPPLGSDWLAANPYRQQPDDVVAIGRDAYNQACARCHGAEASTNTAPAPDLRNLNRSCRHIAEPELKVWCQRDNDAFFAKSVRGGKIIVGVTHMPPWENVLKQELAWAIQLFIESRVSAMRE